MNHTLTQRTTAGTLALLTALIVVVAGWITTAGACAAEHGPTLTNDVGQPPGGTEPQLALGIGLLAIGGLGLVIGLVIGLSKRADRMTSRRK
jgi:hypothetical protein